VRTIVWFRGKDLRVADHAPLADAAAAGDVVPLFVLDPYFFAPARAAALPHRMQFLLDGLVELAARIAALGSRLVVVPGRSVEVVPRLCATWRADRVVAHRWTEPFARERDRRIAAELGDRFALYPGETLHPAGELRSHGGTPYEVFGQFARAFERVARIERPRRAPRRLPPLPDLAAVPETPIPDLATLGLPRNPALQIGGEKAARARLVRFVCDVAPRYAASRDRLDVDGTSRLSADLKFGTLAVREAWHAVGDALGGDHPGAARFRAELLWRELAYHTLWDRPDVLTSPFRAGWRDFPWRDDEAAFRAWTVGATGYPVVDAAARQLLAEGFVPNRARMIAASFLTKDLLIDLRRGEAHYLRLLTDGDWANNDLGWQWAAGSGCDAQPYFRVFNPVVQGERFDPDGAYVRRWVPELARVPARFVHRPWQAPPEVLARAGLVLGRDYPRPIVDHAMARERFLMVAAQHLSRTRRRQASRSGRGASSAGSRPGRNR
jgi:deoxyribodipyrimidine photo-lyase